MAGKGYEMKKQNFRITAVLCAFGLISGVQGLPALASEDFSFGQLSNLTFAFSSGVGAWGTTLTISSDGLLRELTVTLIWATAGKDTPTEPFICLSSRDGFQSRRR